MSCLRWPVGISPNETRSCGNCWEHFSGMSALMHQIKWPCNDISPTNGLKAARKTALVGIALDITMQTLLGMVGAALLVYYLRNPGELPAGITTPSQAGFSDRIFPHFINFGLPVGVSGFVIAAIFAVAQSSIDSGINSTTSVVMVDLV